MVEIKKFFASTTARSYCRQICSVQVLENKVARLCFTLWIERQGCMMRYTFSAETRNIYDSLNLSEADSKKPARIMAAMEDFAKGILNEALERHSFNSRRQEEGEKFDDFLTDIKLLSNNCNFCDACNPSLLRDRIVSGIFSDEIREKLLSEKDLTLEKAMEIFRSKEKAFEGMNTLKKCRYQFYP